MESPIFPGCVVSVPLAVLSTLVDIARSQIDDIESGIDDGTYFNKEHAMSTLSNLDGITRKYTAFTSFNALVNADGNYRPSLACKKGSGFGVKPNQMEACLVVLAEAYDHTQAQRGDSRRVHRF